MTNIKYKKNGNRPTKSSIGLVKKLMSEVLRLMPIDKANSVEPVVNKPKYVPIRSYEEMVERESKMYKIPKEDIILHDGYFENEFRNQLDEINNKPLTEKMIKAAYWENEHSKYRNTIHYPNSPLRRKDLRNRAEYEILENKISMLNNSVLDLKFDHYIGEFCTRYEDVFFGSLIGFIKGEYFQGEQKFTVRYYEENERKKVPVIAQMQKFYVPADKELSHYPHYRLTNEPNLLPFKINDTKIHIEQGTNIFNKYYEVYEERHYGLLEERHKKNQEKERIIQEKQMKIKQQKEKQKKDLVDKLLS